MIPLFFALALQSAGLSLNIPAKHLTPPPKPDQVLARVNGQPIRAEDVQALLWQWRGEEATQDLISYLMVAQEAERKKVSVPDTEVEKALDEQLKTLGQGAPSPEALDNLLRQQGFTRSRLFLRKKAELLVDRLLEAEFKPGDYVMVSTMLVKPDSEQASAVSNAITKAQKSYDRLQKGEAWDKVLADTTSDPQALSTKGHLGWRQLDAFPTPVRAELMKLPKGGVTKPVQTQHGIQIFRLDGAGRSAGKEDLAILKAAFLSGAKPGYIERLKQSSKIERNWPAPIGNP